MHDRESIWLGLLLLGPALRRLVVPLELLEQRRSVVGLKDTQLRRVRQVLSRGREVKILAVVPGMIVQLHSLGDGPERHFVDWIRWCSLQLSCSRRWSCGCREYRRSTALTGSAPRSAARPWQTARKHTVSSWSGRLDRPRHSPTKNLAAADRVVKAEPLATQTAP